VGLSGPLPPADGNTPLDPDEAEGLLPSQVRTQADLNAWEALNIAQAALWYRGGRRRSARLLTLPGLVDLHRRMFGETWVWAGQFRTTDKGIGPYLPSDIGRALTDLCENTAAQYSASTGSAEDLDDIAVRFHHELVRIHPWPNGNGRHARLATDLLLERWGRPAFSWGSVQHEDPLARRAAYLAALRAADGWVLAPLHAFVRG
jgi:Fic-DOC domain mobile mystery protein B